MKTEQYTSKTFPLDAVRVTTENMDEVAKWCKGAVQHTDPHMAEQLGQKPQTWIKVPAPNPLNEKQTQARVGDWVVFIKREFRVYTHASFKRNFEAATTSPAELEKLEDAAKNVIFNVLSGVYDINIPNTLSESIVTELRNKGLTFQEGAKS